MTASVTRAYRFSASHRLHTPALPEAENARIFGKCNNPYGHGHNYELQVTVHGPIDAETGLVVNRDRLDSYVQERVARRFEHKNINLDVPELRELVPTTENMVLVIVGLLEENWDSTFGAPGPMLTRVHIQETGRNGFELTIGDRGRKLDRGSQAEALALAG
jgi:6-pyruvoyltetrahydropterin/6-carboxytetrahydropterin synthase